MRQLLSLTDAELAKDSDGYGYLIIPFKMGDSAVSDAGTESGGKNKRKSADPDVKKSVDYSSVSTDLPEFQFPLAKSENVKESSKEQSGEEAKVSEWDDPIVSQIGELLYSTLHTAFKNAIKKIVECGYTEDIAEKAISRHGLYLEGKDTVANIVSHTLDILKEGKQRDTLGDPSFENLDQLVKYTVLEMVSVLREVKPFLSIAEAMWLLLVRDLNITAACVAEGDILCGFGSKDDSGEGSSSSSPRQKSEAQNSEAFCSKHSLPDSHYSSGALRFGSLPSVSNPENLRLCEGKTTDKASSVSSSASKGQVQITSQLSARDEIPAALRKGRGKKELIALRAKTYQLEKLRSCGKVSNRAGKFTSIGGIFVEKKTKNPSEIPPGYVKTTSLKKSTEAATSAGVKNDSATSSAISASSKPDSKVAVPSSSEKKCVSNSKGSSASVTLKNIDSDAEKNPALKSKDSMGKSSKDEMIVKLVMRVQELQNEQQTWTDWANEKVMQAARKLNAEQAELRALRKEKEEASQFKKEKQIMDENTVKRLSEMESALTNANNQVEQANLSIGKLQGQNTTLKRDMVAACEQAMESIERHQEALDREEKAIRDVQSIDGQKANLQAELEAQKKKVANLQKQVEKAKNLYNQTEAKWRQAQEENKKIIEQAASIRKEREILEAEAKAEEEAINLNAETEKQKNAEEIKRLEDEISELRLKQDSSRIAALRRSTDSGFGMLFSSTSTGNQNPSAPKPGGLKRERECAMCLSDEKVVVFLPCAHQVLCAACNKQHEAEMKECPTCRTPIKTRIQARFHQP